MWKYLTQSPLFRWSKTIVGQVDLTAKLCLSFCLELQSTKSINQTWTYTDETHSDWNLTVDQVKLSEYFFTFQNDLQKQNWDQQDTKLT